MQAIGAMNAQEVNFSRSDLRFRGFEDRIPSVSGDLESKLPKSLPRFSTPLEELIMDVWFAIIYLQEQLDEVCSHSNDVAIACLRFW